MEKNVTFDDAGVLLEEDSGSRIIAWKEIDRIFVFKKDLVVVDLIGLTIDANDNRHNVLNLDEDVGGWLELVQGLPEYLDGCVPFAEWFLAVAFPAFETNPIVIYERGET